MFQRVSPAPSPAPAFVLFNDRLANDLGLGAPELNSAEGLSYFSGSTLPKDAQPFAQAYAGHQFANFTMLGDGRAVMLGEHRTPNGDLFDIQLKGGGQTPYSRRGDGKAALGPMLREYIISEAMHALAIPTTRSLAVVSTGEVIYRENVLEGAILTRVAKSHIRVGTFEYVAASQDTATLKTFTDYTLQRHDPSLADREDKYLAFFQHVMDRQAFLIAQWMLVGFIHGVMNTDNMAISGETIDYGPCAFMNRYDPATVFSSIDRQGRYAFGNQPSIAQWNLTRLAEALLPLFHTDQSTAIELAKDQLQRFPTLYQTYWLSGMRRKLGLLKEEAQDAHLIDSFLRCLAAVRSDYTNALRSLCDERMPTPKMLLGSAPWSEWKASWEKRLAQENRPVEDSKLDMQTYNPFIIPRNHLVEAALRSATVEKDFSVTHKLLKALEDPFSGAVEKMAFTMPSENDETYQTFCGT